MPFQQLTQTGLGGAIGTTEFREAGVSLEVTPHIAPDGTVTMLVHPEFSVLSGFTPDSNAPIIDTREATTTVRVRDRETLVLGGLRQRSKVRGGSSLPLLGDVPLAGRLFRRTTFEVRESELLVFLTPEIVGTGYAGDCREAGIASNRPPHRRPPRRWRPPNRHLGERSVGATSSAGRRRPGGPEFQRPVRPLQISKHRDEEEGCPDHFESFLADHQHRVGSRRVPKPFEVTTREHLRADGPADIHCPRRDKSGCRGPR